MKKSNSLESSNVKPFLLKFKKRIRSSPLKYWYDNTTKLNMTIEDGKLKPLIHAKGSLARLKTKTADIGGGED